MGFTERVLSVVILQGDHADNRITGENGDANPRGPVSRCAKWNRTSGNDLVGSAKSERLAAPDDNGGEAFAEIESSRVDARPRLDEERVPDLV